MKCKDVESNEDFTEASDGVYLVTDVMGTDSTGKIKDGTDGYDSLVQSMLETFRWHVRPESDRCAGTVYTDGSLLCPGHCGWAFVVLDGSGRVVAAASGTPPQWVRTSTAVEEWAFYMAVIHAMPGCVYRIDCETCIQRLHRGEALLATVDRPTAMLWKYIFDAIDKCNRRIHVVWMPAQTRKSEIGKVRLGNGKLLTAADRRGDAIADAMAKRAATTPIFPKRICMQDQDFKSVIRNITTPAVLLRSRAQIRAVRHSIGRP